MKTKFKGYYKLTAKNISSIWSKGFISIDANVLLNLYRYSDDTRNELLNKIERYSKQLWLTYHGAYEFHKNRISVITDQIKTYEDTIKDFEKLEENIIKNLKSPHLSKAIQKTFKKGISEIKRDLAKRKNFYLKLLTNDPILKRVTKIFSGKIGDQLSRDETSKIEKEGEDRYKRKIPPGYKDSDKQDNKFGDLVIWKELIKKSKNEKRPFVFILDDAKEDWWLKARGLTLSPRNELSQELYSEARQSFYMYTPDRFMEYASKGKVSNKEAIKEVQDAQLDVYSNLSFFNHVRPDTFYGQIDPVVDWRRFGLSNQSNIYTTQPNTFFNSPGTIYSKPGTLFSPSVDVYTQPARLVTQSQDVINPTENEIKEEKKKE